MSGGFRRVGDWDKVGNLINNLGRECIEARDTSLKRFGLKAEGIAVKHISTQDLNWQELKPDYLAGKIRDGYSENILVRTSSYFQAITSWILNGSAYIGVRAEAVSKEGEVIADYAKVHEYGLVSRNIPARPLWGPTFDEAKRWFFDPNNQNRPDRIFSRNVKQRYGV